MAKKRKSRVSLSPGDGRCQKVLLPGESFDHRGDRRQIPIGSVCRLPNGYEYYSAPSPHIPRDAKTKARAILAVVKDYKSWIG